MTDSPRQVPPYQALAAVYDMVMAHVDYEAWAEYVLDLIAEHIPEAESILELGCGTGTLALEIQERAAEITAQEGGFDYLATDASPGMIRVAQAKAAMAGATAGRLRIQVADFMNFEPPAPVDVVLLLYDGLNYLRAEEEVGFLLERLAACLLPGGIAIVDQSTPANSINNKDYFGDEGEADGLRYVRRSRYDEEQRLHITEFDLVVEGEHYVEHHVQRAYSLEEVRRLIEASPLSLEAAYDGFTLRSADERTERIHWVLRASDWGLATSA